MKKICLTLFTCLVSLCTFNGIQFSSYNYISKTCITSINKTPNNIIFKHNYTDPEPLGYATMSPFGPEPQAPMKYRNIRLNIFLSGDAYAYFLGLINDGPYQRFLDIFIGDRESGMFDEWSHDRAKIEAVMAHNSEELGFSDDFFLKILTRWFLRDGAQQNFFKHIFNCENTKFSTYDLPEQPTPRNIQRELRRNGMFIQFEFKSTNDEQTLWKVRNAVRLFPDAPKILTLKYYYNDYLRESVSTLNPIPPLINVQVPRVVTDWTVENLSKQIKSSLAFNFDVPNNFMSEGLIAIAPNQSDIKIGNIQDPTSLIINFLYQSTSFPRKKIFYIDKPVTFYGTV